MHTDEAGGLIVSATDLVKHLACGHITTLDIQLARGEREEPLAEDALLDVLFARGHEHETAYLDRLRAEGRIVTEMRVNATSRDELRRAEAATVEAIKGGADVIYQATFFDEVWRGHADFLLKRPDRPGRWAWSYDVADTKLARRLSVAALLQMATYADRLTALQGVAPEQLIVITGDSEQRPFLHTDVNAYTRLVRQAYLDVLAREPPTQPDPVAYCAQCRWRRTCQAHWRAIDDLSLVAFMRRDHAGALRNEGVTTVRDLGSSHPDDLPSGIGQSSRHRLAQQARLQLHERDTGEPCYEVLPPQATRGLALLPPPSPGDVFFDIEGDPFVGDHGLEYLWGLLDADGFYPFWAHTPGEEKTAVEAVIDHLMAAWAADPGMHVYHYASYEPTRLKALTGRYDTRHDELDALLRGERLVDLYAVVRQGLRISKESYSIKELEHFYRGERRAGDGVSDALGSVVAYEEWLATPKDERDGGLLDDIEGYNRKDCESTRDLRAWLEDIRSQAGGDTLFQRPASQDGAASEAAQQVSAEVLELQTALHDRAQASEDAQHAAAYRLLADLLDWHRREARPEWWNYFRRERLDDDALIDDTAAVAGLTDPVDVGVEKRSTLWRMTFPPQDTKLGPGEDGWVDPRTGRPAGTVTAVDPEDGTLVLRRATTRGAPDCTALIPGKPIADRNQRERVRDLARWVLDHSMDDPDPTWRAARNLLQRRPPPCPTGTGLRLPGETAQAALHRLALSLGAHVLAVQGPPGTGKTYAGARTILGLVEQGKRVGVCAASHKAITNMLIELATAAETTGTSLRIVQKATEDQGADRPDIDLVDAPGRVEEAVEAESVDVVAGTAWLFARDGMQHSCDVLVVDEAGQMSLANALAIAGAADGLILLGDPQQLAQPVTGVHPPGADRSVLEHLLGEHATIPADRGLLLDVTRRLHPAITAFVSRHSYDNRLTSHPDCAAHRIDGPGPLAGVGLRFLPVHHQHNSAASTEEADTISRLLHELLRAGRWAGGTTSRPLNAEDVLVLAPYNAHVHRLRARMHDLFDHGLRIGTVDKFQGQQAPLVLYSMASSSVDDAPRGIGFLYERHRFNVAISRAQAVAAVVCSPALLAPHVRHPEQLALVNALDAFAESATSPT